MSIIDISIEEIIYHEELNSHIDLKKQSLNNIMTKFTKAQRRMIQEMIKQIVTSIAIANLEDSFDSLDS